MTGRDRITCGPWLRVDALPLAGGCATLDPFRRAAVPVQTTLARPLLSAAWLRASRAVTRSPFPCLGFDWPQRFDALDDRLGVDRAIQAAAHKRVVNLKLVGFQPLALRARAVLVVDQAARRAGGFVRVVLGFDGYGSEGFAGSLRARAAEALAVQSARVPLTSDVTQRAHDVRWVGRRRFGYGSECFTGNLAPVEPRPPSVVANEDSIALVGQAPHAARALRGDPF